MCDKPSNCEGVQNSILSLQDYEQNEGILDRRPRVYLLQTISEKNTKGYEIQENKQTKPKST